MENLIDVNKGVAYWQHPLFENVGIGTKLDSSSYRCKFVGIENVFERIRPKEYPSRINSILLSMTPNNPTFNNNASIYRVEMYGTIFCADSRKFQEAIHSSDAESIKEWATKYWSGMSNTKEKHTEIILCGEATVVEEVKNEII